MRQRGRCSRRGSATLIGLLVVVAIIMIAVWWLYLRPAGNVQRKPRFAGEAQTVLGQSLQKGQTVDCINNLHQLRMALQMEKDSTGEWPAALDPKWGVPLKCAVSGQAFKYDPATGAVSDPTPGHEKY
ncbi:MAG TPA: hypothetical protein VGM19_13140 [Armatimonadota bacterium]